MVPLPLLHCADLWLRHVPREVRPIAATYAGVIGDLTHRMLRWSDLQSSHTVGAQHGQPHAVDPLASIEVVFGLLHSARLVHLVQMFRAVRLLKQLCDLLSTRIV